MELYAKLQGIKTEAAKSFISNIQDKLGDFIKDIEKNYNGDYNGSIDKFKHISTDKNIKWTLQNDKCIRICLRPCAYSDNLNGGTVLACCRLSSDHRTRYLALVKIGENEEWYEVHGLDSELFDEIDQREHSSNSIWSHNSIKLEIDRLIGWIEL